ncbi:MAG: hypothetical protein F6K39_42155 [Okeania sp. SIO3B3]|nr:hypothetical protein [Okeania sp. SIO3B3]
MTFILSIYTKSTLVISCSVEYLHSGGRKAEGSYGKERFKGRRFLITNYPDMILQ